MMPPDATPSILLVAINARFTHASLGARYLLANMGDLRDQTALLECHINQSPEEMLAAIASRAPRIIGIGVYIWNRTLVESLIPLLHRHLPDSLIVLGGPEISHDTHSPLADAAQVVVCGEADHTFAQLCHDLLRGTPVPHLITAPPPALAHIALPYHTYSSEDLAHRAVYVESTRGCPHHCQFCLSACDTGIRLFPEETIHQAIASLIQAGAKNLRFVDRSFNLAGPHATRLLDMLLAHAPSHACCVHLELTPDGLTPAIRERLAQFPENTLHVEVGIQTLDPIVSARVDRPIDPVRVRDGVRFLVTHTRAAVHADLIAGLPGETPDSFVHGFNQLHAWHPHELQVGILKGLPGTPILNQATEWGLRFNPSPPYTILETSTMPPTFLQTVSRFAAHWERIVNRRHLPRTIDRWLGESDSPWHRFLAFSDTLAASHGSHGIALLDICKALLAFIPTHTPIPHAEVQRLLHDDFFSNGRRPTVPTFLRPDPPPTRST